MDERNKRVSVGKSAPKKNVFQRRQLLIFALLLTLCACVADNPDRAVKTETTGAAENAIVEIEEESPFGRWGAILPVPEGDTGVLDGVFVYRNSAQEIIIQYQYGPYNTSARTRRFFNFSKGELEVECKDAECTNKAISGLDVLEEEEISFVKYTSFGGGFRRRISGGGEDRNSMDEGYEVLFGNGTVSYEKILWLSTERVKALNFRFYVLGENITLGIATKGGRTADDPPIVVVFKNNLISPYFKNNKEFFKMDGGLADSIYRVCSADARVKNNTEKDVRKIADACFAETIKNGISDDLKKNLEKRIEQFYVNKKNGDIIPSLNGEWSMVLPLPEEYEYFGLSGVYFNINHEIIILYSFRTKEDYFWRVFNLSRGIREDEYKVLDIKRAQPWIDEKTAGLEKIHTTSFAMLLSGDSTRNEKLGEGFSWKSSYNGNNYVVISPNGDMRFERIMQVYPEKYKFVATGPEDIQEENYIHIQTVIFRFYQLDKHTLLGNSGGIFVIFRNDLTSPFFEKNPSFVQIDGKRVESIHGECFTGDLDRIEKIDKCYVDFLKGEYPWLNLNQQKAE